MSQHYYDVRHLIYKRNRLPKDALERQEIEASIRYVLRRMPDLELRMLLRATEMVGTVCRTIGSALQALGLNGLRWKIAERLRGDY